MTDSASEFCLGHSIVSRNVSLVEVATHCLNERIGEFFLYI